ncbi:zf-HC2 domain-containing protein [Pseudonocardia yunnanensis]|uniref:Anti-sigma factor family protein n=1 Tax=Pseudonocardia yunnanensis TaxID=58107 RepID=A0ABW4EK05_9PSEU
MRLSDNHADIDGYVIGELDPEKARVVEEHLARCPGCREEVRSLREVQRLLASVPMEAVLDGPPDDADLLLQRTLREVRSEESGTTSRRTKWASAAAAVVAAAALCIGVLVGWNTADSPQMASAAPGAPSPAPMRPGTRFITAQDPGTGARLTVRLVPAPGWVRLNAAVSGIPAGQACHLVVIGRNGDRETAGGWLVSARAATMGVTLDGAALMDPAKVSMVVVESTNGSPLVSADV